MQFVTHALNFWSRCVDTSSWMASRVTDLTKRIPRHIEAPKIGESWRLGAYFGVGLLLVCVALVGTHNSPQAAFGSGLLAGLFIAGVGACAWQTAGSGARRLATASEHASLQQLRRAAQDGWFAFNGLSFEHAGDCDHFVIGAGGAFVLKRAWCGASDSQASERQLVAAAHAARGIARRAKQLLSAHPTRLSIDVTPVLIVFGPGHTTRSIDGVPVVQGDFLAGWLTTRAHPKITADDVARAYAAINEFAASEAAKLTAPDPLDEVVAFGLRGLVTCAATALAAGVASFVGVMLIAASLRLGPVLGVAAAAVAGGWLFLRDRRLHYAGLGWLTGAAMGAVVLVAVVAVTGYA